MTKILDASALLAHLEKEAGYEIINDVLAEAAGSDEKLLMSAVNWGEVYYIVLRQYGKQKASEVALLIDTFPIEIVPADRTLAKTAATYKAVHRLPYADAFAAALTKLRKGVLLTRDKEFRAVEHDIKIMWL